MTHTTRILLVASVSILAFGAGLAETEEFEIFTCRDADGNVSFQNDPCPEIEEQETAPKPARSTSPVSTPQPPTPAKAKPAVTPPAAEPVRRTTVSWTRVSPAPATPKPRTLGKQMFPTSLAGSAPPSSASFLSPEQTWRTFLAAIESGDRGAASACLTLPARKKLAPDPESFPLDELRALVGTFLHIEDEGHLGPYWTISAARTDRRPKWILFEQTDAGEWKISGI